MADNTPANFYEQMSSHLESHTTIGCLLSTSLSSLVPNNHQASFKFNNTRVTNILLTFKAGHGGHLSG